MSRSRRAYAALPPERVPPFLLVQVAPTGLVLIAPFLRPPRGLSPATRWRLWRISRSPATAWRRCAARIG